MKREDQGSKPLSTTCMFCILPVLKNVTYWKLSLLRLAYPVWILNSLLDETDDKCIDVHVLYDIACLLETHLEVF